jgi:N-acetylglutamate synthase
MKARFSVRIAPTDVGERVTVRFRIDADEGEPGHSDVVGTLLSWDDGLLRIANRHGDTIVVPADRLVAGKVVGPPPNRRTRPEFPPA